MEITILKPAKVTARYIKCILPVNHEEEEIPNTFPGRKGEQLVIVLDIDERKVCDWPDGYGAAECHMKVVDCGIYILQDEDGRDLCRLDDYVPECIPESYGDYVEFDIEADGTLTDWHPEVADLEASFYPKDE